MNGSKPVQINKKYYLYFVLMCGIILCSYKSCHAPSTVNTIQIPVRQNNVQNTARGKETNQRTKEVYVPSEGSVTVVSKDDKKKVSDVVEFKVKTHGFTRKLGFQYAVPKYFGLDLKFYYWSRLGVNIGLLGDRQGDFGDTLTLSYKLDRLKIFDNLEIYGGEEFNIVQPKRIVFGLRINL